LFSALPYLMQRQPNAANTVPSLATTDHKRVG